MSKKVRSKGMRRAYLKRFSAAYINAGQQMGKGGANYEIARALPSEAAKQAPTGEMPSPFHAAFFRADGFGVIPRNQVLTKLWQGENRMQGDTTYNVVALSKEIKMYFAGMDFFFLKIIGKTVIKSVHYNGRDRAMDAFRREGYRGGIIWAEHSTAEG